jgi:catechol 2,3-dioxygenase-like lactoylglutathione lyase family enzyme
MAKPARLAHIVLMTRRYQQMIDWYCKVFEARVVHADPALAFLTFDDENHRFAFANLDILKPGGGGGRGEIGVNHVAFTYAGIDDLLTTYVRLKAAGITPYWPVHHGMTLSLYYQDPDDNRLELQVDTLGSEDAFKLMQSPAFAENGVGHSYDPDALVVAWQSGASAETLLKSPGGPPSPIPAEHGLFA